MFIYTAWFGCVLQVLLSHLIVRIPVVLLRVRRHIAGSQDRLQ